MTCDPGLQPERTSLAWHRTGLAMLFNGALLVRTTAEAHSPALVTVASLVVIAALLTFAVAWHRDKMLARPASPVAPHTVLVMLLVGSVWIACTAAALTMLNW